MAFPTSKRVRVALDQPVVEQFDVVDAVVGLTLRIGARQGGTPIPILQAIERLRVAPDFII